MEQGLFLITLGTLFLGGLLADQLGRLTRLPRVTMLLLLGLAAGPAGLGLIPEAAQGWFELISDIALTMVAFLLGGELTMRNLSRHGSAIMSISISVAVGTMVMVAAGLWLAGLDPGLALVLGAIATATAPAAITDVIHQSGVRNGFTETLAGIVAIDDVWGLVLFSLALALATQTDGLAGLALGVGHEIGGAILIGLAVGWPAAILTGRLTPGEPLQTEAIGIVLLTGGIAIWAEVSFLVAGMTAGAVVANFARHHDYAFHEIEHIEWPFMLLFFLLAGASLEIDALLNVGMIGILLGGLRIVSRLVFAWLGAHFGGVAPAERRLFGPALLPQAGVAVGMALVAADTLPEWSSTILALTIATTVLFEIIGPPCTLFAIRRTSGGTRRPD